MMTRLVKELPQVIWLLDLHEVLDRVCERFIEPQCEILAAHKSLIDPRPELIVFQPAHEPIERLELDDALQAVVIATTRYAREQYEATRRHFGLISSNQTGSTDRHADSKLTVMGS